MIDTNSTRDSLYPLWTPEELESMRIMLKLTKSRAGELLDISDSTIANLENGKTTNPLLRFAYGTLLCRIYAKRNGYIPGYKKAGSNEFVERFSVKWHGCLT